MLVEGCLVSAPHERMDVHAVSAFPGGKDVSTTAKNCVACLKSGITDLTKSLNESFTGSLKAIAPNLKDTPQDKIAGLNEVVNRKGVIWEPYTAACSQKCVFSSTNLYETIVVISLSSRRTLADFL
jgi:hypothetical protein